MRLPRNAPLAPSAMCSCEEKYERRAFECVQCSRSGYCCDGCEVVCCECEKDMHKGCRQMSCGECHQPLCNEAGCRNECAHCGVQICYSCQGVFDCVKCGATACRSRCESEVPDVCSACY